MLESQGMTEGTQEASLTIKEEPAFWRAPLEFAVHAVVGTCIFAIIAGPEVLLQFALEQLESRHLIDNVIIVGLKAAEYALFTTGLMLYGIFLWRTAKRTVQHL